jgi:rubredoxin
MKSFMKLNAFTTVKINFKGGIISPGDLKNILEATEDASVSKVSFGQRQQLFIDVRKEKSALLCKKLNGIGLHYEVGTDRFPNIVSSYPAEEAFITKTWLSEGVYKDIFDSIESKPRLKVNICDSNQSFTPMLTGNINWIASLHSIHFWHVFIRFPKTNVIYEWDQLVYTNDIARMTQHLETIILQNPDKFYDRPGADGNELFSMIMGQTYNIKPVDRPAQLPAFNLPYYEGLNRYNDKFWLGIYRRDEMFEIDFLKDLCAICLETKIGLICSTSWKTLIVKGIEEKDRLLWNALLAKHRVNMRHAANELNFQIEDHCKEGLRIKNYLVRQFSRDDVRTFGLCFGVKTRRKSEVFSSILVKRKSLVRLGKYNVLNVYDILCANGFNPNERTGFISGRNIPKFMLPGRLRITIAAFYVHQAEQHLSYRKVSSKKDQQIKMVAEFVHQCPNCFTVYDPSAGDKEAGISPGTSLEQLSESYCCPLCETPKNEFREINKQKLLLQPV